MPTKVPSSFDFARTSSPSPCTGRMNFVVVWPRVLCPKEVFLNGDGHCKAILICLEIHLVLNTTHSAGIAKTFTANLPRTLQRIYKRTILRIIVHSQLDTVP